MNSRQWLHARLVGSRRMRALAVGLSQLLPRGASVLDLGCGDGAIASELARLRSDLVVRGMDVDVRAATEIAVEKFDGVRIPLAAGQLDFVVLCDVLHHLTDMRELLAEARRVAGRGVIIKDHFAESIWDRAQLALMDAAGNPASVPMPHHYLSEAEWRVLWARVGLAPTGPIERTLGLYPAAFDRVFGRGLHFMARLERSA